MIKPLHVGISVGDIQAAIQWYQSILGFSLLCCRHFPALNTQIAFLKLGDFEIELFEPDQPNPLPDERRLPITDLQTPGTKHIAFSTDDIETLFADFREQGVDIVFGPVESPPKDALFGFIRDNSGVLIEFIQKQN